MFILLRPQWRRAVAGKSIFLSNVALLSANRAGVGYIFHVPESIQIASWNASVIMANKHLTIVHTFCRVFLLFLNFLNTINTIFEGAHFAPGSPRCTGLPYLCYQKYDIQQAVDMGLTSHVMCKILVFGSYCSQHTRRKKSSFSLLRYNILLYFFWNLRYLIEVLKCFLYGI